MGWGGEEVGMYKEVSFLSKEWDSPNVQRTFGRLSVNPHLIQN